jgi:glycosyltransferase involved in cell wall biosynthesis
MILLWRENQGHFMLSAVAILCIRNEAVHIRRCLESLIGEGLEIILIDNDSTDQTRSIAAEFLGRGLLSIERLPWRGAFSLSDQLACKATIVNHVPHDWIVHIDADEWLSSPQTGQSLVEGIAWADGTGANCINFDEFVFIPTHEQNFGGDHYHRKMLGYYFFQPTYPRLLRAWKRSAGLNNERSGGHSLSGLDVRRFEHDFILRHYIVLGEEQAKSKYVERRFSAEDRAKGWHGNRVNITEDNLILPPAANLTWLPEWESKAFAKEPIRTRHFWEWNNRRDL